MISAFWASSLLSRLLVALFLPAGHEATLVLCLAVLGTIVVLGVLLTKRAWIAPLLVIGAGLASGPVLPTVLAVLFDGFDRAEHGRAVGLTLGISNLGYTSAPILVGMIAKRTSIRHSFVVLLVAGFAFIACSALLVAWR
jgi:fucose permease